MFQNTDGISKHRLSPYRAYVYYLDYKHYILFNVSAGSNCNLIFVLKSFSVVHCMQLSGNAFRLSTILFQCQ